MLHNNQDYNTYYGVGILDDLHNYFPDLLYNPRRFNNVQDVLNYIRSITQYRFDRFSTAQAERQQPGRRWQTHPRQPRQPGRRWQTHAQQQQTQPRSDNYRMQLPTLNTPLNTYANLFATTAPAPITTATTMFDFTLPATTTVGEPYDIENTTALLTLLGLFAAPATTIPPLTPVIVAPSRETIINATNTYTISEEPVPPGVCVICQENFALSNTVRTITYCGHAFHDSCILRHFETSVRCPTCRFDIRDSRSGEHN